MGSTQATWRHNWKPSWVICLCCQVSPPDDTTDCLSKVKLFLWGLSGLYLCIFPFHSSQSDAAQVLLLPWHNPCLINICPPVWSWRTSQVQNPSPIGQKHNRANCQTSEWQQHLSTSRWGEWRNFCPSNLHFFISHILPFKCMENVHFLYYTDFSISFPIPRHHQINMTLQAIMHVCTITPLSLHTLRGIPPPAREVQY